MRYDYSRSDGNYLMSDALLFRIVSRYWAHIIAPIIHHGIDPGF